MVEGLVVFTSHVLEEKVFECLGCTLEHNTRTRFENGYAVSKYNIRGAVYNVAVIRGNSPHARAAQLANKLGGGSVYLFDPDPLQTEPTTQNVKRIDTVASLAEAFQIRLSPTECDQLRNILERNHQATTMRNYVNPETPGDAEQQYSNRFFSAASSRRHIPPPDADLFQGAVFFLPQGRAVVVHNNSNNNSDEDSDFLLAQQLSLQQEQTVVVSSPPRNKRIRRTPATWESVLKQSEPLVSGQPSCVTCHSFRASICFECGHQVMCDDCVRQMCQLPGVRRACPICRCESESILRPILSEIEK